MKTRLRCVLLENVIWITHVSLELPEMPSYVWSFKIITKTWSQRWNCLMVLRYYMADISDTFKCTTFIYHALVNMSNMKFPLKCNFWTFAKTTIPTHLKMKEKSIVLFYTSKMRKREKKVYCIISGFIFFGLQLI